MTPVRHQAARYWGVSQLMRTDGAAYRRGHGRTSLGRKRLSRRRLLHTVDGSGAFRSASSASIAIGLTMHPSKPDMQLLPFKSICPVRATMRVFCARPLVRSSRHMSRPSLSGRLISIRMRSNVSSEQRCSALTPLYATQARCPSPSAMSANMSAHATWSSTNKTFMLFFPVGVRQTRASRAEDKTVAHRLHLRVSPNHEQSSAGCGQQACIDGSRVSEVKPVFGVASTLYRQVARENALRR